MTGGNGGGYAGWSTLLVGGDDGLTDAGSTGQFTGVVDAMDFNVHMLVDTLLTPDSTPVLAYNNDYPIDLDITIDGVAVHTTGSEPVRGALRARGEQQRRHLPTGLHRDRHRRPPRAVQRLHRQRADTVHQIDVRIGSHFLDVAWIMVFDTTEVPGGITFNPVVVPTESTIIPVS